MAIAPAVYETTFIVNAGLEDLQIDNLIEKVKETITKNGGTIRDVAKWGRKRFAYSIRRKSNGFYVVIEFSGPGDIVAKLERHYQLDENVIRYLTIHLDPKKLAVRVVASEMFKQQATPVPGAPTPTPAPATAAAKEEPAPAPAVAPAKA